MKYRKKPVVIEAEQWHEPEVSLGFRVKDKLGVYEDGPFRHVPTKRYGVVSKGQYYIDTLEGRHEVTDGDWIITGVKGERYPCKSDIFEMTYEKVE